MGMVVHRVYAQFTDREHEMLVVVKLRSGKNLMDLLREAALEYVKNHYPEIYAQYYGEGK